MNAQSLQKLEGMARTIALWTSLAATIFLAVFFLASYSEFNYQFQQYAAGRDVNVFYPLFFGLMLSAVLGYLLGFSKRLDELGGVITVVAVVGIYWVSYASLGYTLRPEVMALAAPALFHLAAVELRRAAARRTALRPAKPAEAVQPAFTPAEVRHEERELAAGAA